MTALDPTLPQVHLRPGELVVTHEPILVVTLLGSCVAVTLFSAAHGFAAICHAMLPRPGHANPSSAARADRFKYVSEAIPFMVARFRERGISPTSIEVKLFGGGHVTLSPAHRPISMHHIGSSNVDLARELLAAQGLSPAATNVGGLCGRKLIFNTQTGEVRHKHLAHSSFREAA